ncbi:hypothetical protein [Caballeronia sp. INDeC2]|uniref:hypothetical protein n=1 Tax=Caballeronia sp. INDeC2 TaxID=2921747 RepID=UPI002027E8BC|nr:hypothetical protein [Caballeronia sp. INDeC2]
MNSRTEFAKALLAYGGETMAQASFHRMEHKFGEVMRIYDEHLREIERQALERAAEACERVRSVSAVSYETGTACANAIRALMKEGK